MVLEAFFKSYKIKPQNIQFEEAMVRFQDLNPLACPHLRRESKHWRALGIHDVDLV
jgi:hypothetical protein